jgi:hypothetical protein
MADNYNRQPIYINTPIKWAVKTSATGNTAWDGTGTLVTLGTATGKAKLTVIAAHFSGTAATPASNRVTIFLDRGGTVYSIGSIALTTSTPSATVAPPSSFWTPSAVDYFLEEGDVIKIGLWTAGATEQYSVTAELGAY